MVAWNSRIFLQNNYLLFIGIAYLFISCVDTLHVLAYRGMNVFADPGANLATQLWIVGRYMESLSLACAPLFFNKNLKAHYALCVYALATALLLGAIFYWHVFPACYVEGIGLTSFKVASEYIISIILLVAVFLLVRKREELDAQVFKLITASILTTIASEMVFTLYVDVYGLYNLTGHLLKVLSFYFIYRAIIQTSLVKPYNSLFRNLKKSEEKLKLSVREKDVLLREVHHRVKNNMQVVLSFLRIQGSKIKDEKYAKMFRDSQMRIRSMAMIHDMLYHSKNLAQIDFKTYIKDLANTLFQFFGLNGDSITMVLDVEDVELDLDNSITCGFILNELIGNAIMHAFPDARKGRIRISIGTDSQKRVVLKVCDNGIGLPETIDHTNTETLGLRLVNILAEDQLNGTLTLNRTLGTEFTICFKNFP